MRVNATRSRLRRELQGGDELLLSVVGRAEKRLGELSKEVHRLIPELAQAELDLQVMKEV
jgi:hypothetical protein